MSAIIPLDRRQFLQLSAASALGLALPARALAAPGLAAGPAPADAGPGPAIEVRETAKDGGVVEEGTVVKYQFRVANRGKADLEITRVKPDCGCSIARWDKVIKPGAES